MADIDLKAATPDTTLPTTGFLFGADSQAASAPSVYSTQTVATTLLGSTSLTGATITADAPVLNMSQTWNASGVTFTGLRFNATDTASAAGSLLMDLQVGGSSRFQFFKNGGGVVIATSGTGTGQFGVRLSGDAASRAVIGLDTADNGVVGFGSGSVSRDTFFGRRGPANLRLGAADAAAPVAQTLSVQSVVAGTTNTAGANLTITGSQGTGTGAGGSILFQVAPAGSSGSAQNALATFLEATSARAFNLYNTTDVTTNFERGKIAWESNVLRIGTEKGGTGTARALELQTDGTTRLTIQATSNNVIGAGSFYAQSAAGFFMNNRAGIQSSADGIIRLMNWALNDFDRLQFGGTTSSFPALKRSTTSLIVRLADDSADAGLQCAALTVTGNLTISTKDIVTDTTTGTKIGTSTSQKIGFFNKTPVVQPTAVADATDNATAITQLNALLSRMRDLGLIAT